MLTVVAALALTGCGGDGSVSLPTVSASLPSISVTLPSLTRSPSAEPEPTESTEAPTEEASETPTEEPSTPTEEPTTAEPTRTAVVTRTVTPTEPATPTPEPSPTPSATVSALEPTDEAADTGIPSWVWWLLAAAALAALVAGVLVPRSRRRAAWTADLTAAEAEAGWFARELLPQLQRTSTSDALAGGWQVAAGRVTSLEDRLTGLESSAPDDTQASRPRQLRDAVRAARSGVERLIAAGDMGSSAAQLGSIAAQLAASLPPIGPGGATGPPRHADPAG